MTAAAIVDTVRRHALPLDLETGASRLLEAIPADATLVLIGEATHGTHEFYRIRADLTRALIERRGFTIWPRWRMPCGATGGPQLFGYPLIGLVGFVAASVLGIGPPSA